MRALIRRIKKYCPREKPYLAFLKKVEGLLLYLQGELSKGKSNFWKSFEYYLSVEDELNAVKSYLLILLGG